jgi:hypothetical protein
LTKPAAAMIHHRGATHAQEDATMLRLIAEDLEGETVEFQVWQIDHTYFEDDVTYIRTATNSPHRVPVVTSSICCADCAQEE